MKIFIDTNLFLDFYRGNPDKIEKLFDLSQLERNLILCEQGKNEFLRNRDAVFNLIIAKLKENAKDNAPFSTTFIRVFDEFEELKNCHDQFLSIINVLQNKIEKVKNTPEIDPIFINFKNLYENGKIPIYETTDELFKRAHRRSLEGNPPQTKQKGTIGDEIIWEVLLHNIKDDLLIVSRDSTFKNHFFFLKKEFKERTGNDFYIEEKISKAFESVDLTPNEDLKEFEKKKEVVTSPISYQGIPIIGDLVSVATQFASASGSSPELDTSFRCPQCHKEGWFYNGICPYCGFRFDSVEVQ